MIDEVNFEELTLLHKIGEIVVEWEKRKSDPDYSREKGGVKKIERELHYYARKLQAFWGEIPEEKEDDSDE